MKIASIQSFTDHQRAIIGQCLAKPGARRTEISETLGISAQTTMRAVLPLVKAGVLEETQLSTGGRGKPASSLKFASGSLLTLGISLASDRVRVNFSDLNGDTLMSRRKAGKFSIASAQVAELDRILDECVADLASDAQLVGIGVSIQGYFLERGKRFAARADPEGWAAINLKTHLFERFGVPIRMMNDGKTLASSQQLSAPYSDFICLNLGTGVGGGIVSNNMLVTGIHGNAGELGRLFTMGKDRPIEANFLKPTGLGGWEDWQGIHALPQSRQTEFLAFVDTVAENMSRVFEQVLAILDFEAVYICSRMPADILQMLCKKVSIAPLGTDLVGQDSALRNAAPDVHARHVPNFADLACNMALETFLTPTDVPVS